MGSDSVPVSPVEFAHIVARDAGTGGATVAILRWSARLLLWLVGAYVGWWGFFAWLVPAVLHLNGLIYTVIGLPLAYLLPLIVAARFAYVHRLRGHLSSRQAAWSGAGAMVMLVVLNEAAGWFRAQAVPFRERGYALVYMLAAVICVTGASWLGGTLAVWQEQRKDANDRDLR